MLEAGTSLPESARKLAAGLFAFQPTSPALQGALPRSLEAC